MLDWLEMLEKLELHMFWKKINGWSLMLPVEPRPLKSFILGVSGNQDLKFSSTIVKVSEKRIESF